MASRRSPSHKHSTSCSTRYGSLIRRKYPLRHSPSAFKQPLLKANSNSHALEQDATPIASRPVLVPLHFNLRRLPSRMAISRHRDISARDHSDVQVGLKRKRATSTNENAYVPRRGSRAAGTFKRRRSQLSKDDTSDEEYSPPQSAMELDDETAGHWLSDHSDIEDSPLHTCTRPVFPFFFTYSLVF